MSKKLLPIILLFLLLSLIPSIVYADVPDLSKLSDEDLLSVIQDAQKLLFDSKLNEGVRVPQGTYTIGIDIPAGTYRIEITDGTGYYDVFDKEGGYKIFAGLTGKSYKVTDIGKITFEEGNVLVLVNSTFIFYPYVGLFY